MKFTKHIYVLLYKKNNSAYLQHRLNRKVNVMSKQVKTVNRCKPLQNISVLTDVSSVKLKSKILDDIGAYSPEIGLNENIHIPKNELTTSPFHILVGKAVQELIQCHDQSL